MAHNIDIVWKYNLEKHCIDGYLLPSIGNMDKEVPQKPILVSSEVDWKDGEDVTGKFTEGYEGRDIGTEWQSISLSIYKIKTEPFKRIVAIPIIQEQPQNIHNHKQQLESYQITIEGQKNIIKTLEGKLEFYRQQTEKLGNYLNENKIGRPTQGFYDAIYEHLQSVNQSQEQPKQEAISPDKKIEAYKKLLKVADCPQFLIDNPTVLFGKPTDADFEWAKEKIAEYEADQIKFREPAIEGDAVEFAEWMNKKGYVKYWGNEGENCNKWYIHYSLPDRDYFTTEELYKLFKNNPPKQEPNRIIPKEDQDYFTKK